jgi:phospholipase/carboxylesterase
MSDVGHAAPDRRYRFHGRGRDEVFRSAERLPTYRASMTKIVNGASRQPLSGSAPRQIVLLLHGFGSSGSDLISFVPHWQQALPDALFLAPHAPQRCAFGGGYQWWALNSFTPQALAAGAASAAGAVDALIDRKLDQYGLSEAQLAIVGFSQGTMMALHVGLRRKKALAGIVGYSGMLTGGRDLVHQVVTRPPVLLVHGSADRVVPVGALHGAEATLRRIGVDVTTHVSAGVGHTVDPVGLRMGVDFVAKVLDR